MESYSQREQPWGCSPLQNSSIPPPQLWHYKYMLWYLWLSKTRSPLLLGREINVKTSTYQTVSSAFSDLENEQSSAVPGLAGSDSGGNNTHLQGWDKRMYNSVRTSVLWKHLHRPHRCSQWGNRTKDFFKTLFPSLKFYTFSEPWRIPASHTAGGEVFSGMAGPG